MKASAAPLSNVLSNGAVGPLLMFTQVGRRWSLGGGGSQGVRVLSGGPEVSSSGFRPFFLASVAFGARGARTRTLSSYFVTTQVVKSTI